MATAKEIRRRAKETLGIEQLRPGQLEAIEAVAGGRDTLAVMSTGYGKSAIYQLAATFIEGPTIVVSPLIALQRDQVEAMEEATPGEAAELNSTLSEGKREELMESLRGGEREFVLLAPEQLAKEEVLEELRDAGPSLLVVLSYFGEDHEAPCGNCDNCDTGLVEPVRRLPHARSGVGLGKRAATGGLRGRVSRIRCLTQRSVSRIGYAECSCVGARC